MVDTELAEANFFLDLVESHKDLSQKALRFSLEVCEKGNFRHLRAWVSKLLLLGVQHVERNLFIELYSRLERTATNSNQKISDRVECHELCGDMLRGLGVHYLEDAMNHERAILDIVESSNSMHERGSGAVGRLVLDAGRLPFRPAAETLEQLVRHFQPVLREQTQHELAKLYYWEGRTDKAELLWTSLAGNRNSIAGFPHWTEVYVGLAVVSTVHGKHEVTKNLLVQATELMPDGLSRDDFYLEITKSASPHNQTELAAFLVRLAVSTGRNEPTGAVWPGLLRILPASGLVG